MQTQTAVGRPEAGEYKEYQKAYVALVPQGDILEILDHEGRALAARLRRVSPERALQPIAPGKWTVQQMLHHITDCERVFTYRGLAFARGDQNELPGFEQDDYANAAGSNSVPWSSLIDEFEVVRGATILLFQHLPAEAWMRTGTANNGLFTVRAIAYVTAGHALYHARQLEEYGII